MSQQELLKIVVGRLKDLRIPYFVTGSWSSSLLGEPRSTHDLDLVIQLDTGKASQIVASFAEERFYLSANAVNEAVLNDSMFNLLDLESGDKVDFWMLTDSAWDQERFRRREIVDVFGVEVSLATAEDTIIAKLKWSKLSNGSEKQIQDARGVYQVQEAVLDIAYLKNWVRRLELTHEWQLLVE